MKDTKARSIRRPRWCIASSMRSNATCSRFRADSELSRAGRAGDRPVEVSPLLADLVETALAAAHETDGDVDPTVGSALCGLGYDRDFAAIAVQVYPPANWRRVRPA